MHNCQQRALNDSFLRELERAVLPVEGEISDVDGAGGAEDGRWQPVAETIIIHQYITVVGYFKLGIITEAWREEEGTYS